MRTILDEINDTKRLIKDQRESLYSLQTHYSPEVDRIIQDRKIIIKGLESYLSVLEHTVNCRSRKDQLLTTERQIND